MELKKLKQTSNYESSLSEDLILTLSIALDVETSLKSVSGHIIKNNTPVAFLTSDSRHNYNISISKGEELTPEERLLIVTKSFELLENDLIGE
ncbi:hypothetical protein [Massilibacteroides sp.]|uniref:hypothetical protein n=1 Tax=Massilibacteroides sp. TaxID=2034766 RepID=UPI00260CD381|nr:hypothetical protein [Massilibacteroides sp.]MDD4516463.1 hypothetical protein [Massilibacteroides sp.]